MPVRVKRLSRFATSYTPISRPQRGRRPLSEIEAEAIRHHGYQRCGGGWRKMPKRLSA